MCITRSQILEWNEIIQQLNSIGDEKERELYLQDKVEDTDLFLSALKKVNKSKLVKSKNKKTTEKRNSHFTQKMVIDLFNEYTLEDIIAEYSKQELSDMYSIFYSVKPLTSFDKAKIVQMIHQYIYKMNRAGVLLG